MRPSQALNLHRDAVCLAAERHRVANPRVFGSALRGDDSEGSDLVHVQAVVVFSQQGMEHTLRFELHHKDIIDRFGRYPHRNAILGRTSSAEELAFLSEPGSSF